VESKVEEVDVVVPSSACEVESAALLVRSELPTLVVVEVSSANEET
jgi:hypothetical protein